MSSFYVNNQAFPLDIVDTYSLLDALHQAGFSPQNARFAVAINQKFIPRSSYAMTFVQAGDRVEIVAAAQGG